MEKGLHHQADSVLQVQVRVCVYVRLYGNYSCL